MRSLIEDVANKKLKRTLKSAPLSLALATYMNTSKMKRTGRAKKASAIQIADKASVLGRLMLGKVNDWEEFLKPSTTDYTKLTRDQLRSGYIDVKSRLQKEIETFYSKNFVQLEKKKIIVLYDDIVSQRGLQVPLMEFEERYGKVNRVVLKKNPAHLTVSITLWGLKFLFPEDLLAKDILAALEILKESKEKTMGYKSLPDIRRIEFAQRAIVLSSFNLMESYLNGLAWDYCQSHDLSALSKRKANLLTDTANASIREKLIKYPAIILGRDDFTINGVNEFLDVIKPFRDSLVHPSPFSAPEKFGGYEKLKKLYELDYHVAITAVASIVLIIKGIVELIEKSQQSPQWLHGVEDWLSKHGGKKELTIGSI